MGKRKKKMSLTAAPRRHFGRRARVAALCALALASSFLIAALFRDAQSRQTPADPASEALPHLNLLGRHAARAAEYARQVKARYPPSSPQSVEARRRYQEAAEKFDSLLDALADSARRGSGARSSAQLREKARLAVEAGDSFADWAEGGLQLLGRARTAQGAGAPPKGPEVVEAAGRLTDFYGRGDERAKGRTLELMNELARFRPWDEIPPVTAPGAAASPQASPSASPSPSPSRVPSTPDPH